MMDEQPRTMRSATNAEKKQYRVSTERHPYCMANEFFDDLDDLDDADDQEKERGGALNSAFTDCFSVRITTFTKPASAATATSADRQLPATAQTSRGDENRPVLAHVVSATSIAKEEEEEEAADEHPIITATSAEKRKYCQNAAWEAQDQQGETVDTTDTPAALSPRGNVSLEVDPSTKTTTTNAQNKRHCNSNSSSLPSPAHSSDSSVSTGLTSPHVTRRKADTCM